MDFWKRQVAKPQPPRFAFWVSSTDSIRQSRPVLRETALARQFSTKTEHIQSQSPTLSPWATKTVRQNLLKVNWVIFCGFQWKKEKKNSPRATALALATWITASSFGKSERLRFSGSHRSQRIKPRLSPQHHAGFTPWIQSEICCLCAHWSHLVGWTPPISWCACAQKQPSVLHTTAGCRVVLSRREGWHYSIRKLSRWQVGKDGKKHEENDMEEQQV